MERFAAELRSATVDGGRLVGHAAVFNRAARVTDRKGVAHWERLAPTAFDAVLSSDPDVRALINHDPNLLLARTANGTLKLDVDDDGLIFDADLPDTSYARDLRELVAGGLLTGASFAFVPGRVERSPAPDGLELRTHVEVDRVLDVSAVTYPAYAGAGVELRAVTFPAHPLRRYRTRLILARAAQKGIRP